MSTPIEDGNRILSGKCFHPTISALCLPLRQAVVTRIKETSLPPGLDAAHVAQALGEGRGSQADLVVAIMETKGTGRIDFYEVRL